MVQHRFASGPRYLQLRRRQRVFSCRCRKNRLRHTCMKDLERYQVFGARDAVERRSVRFTKGSREEVVLFHPQIVCRNNLAALHCSLTGKGAALSVPRFLAQSFLNSGELVRLLPDWNVSSLPLRAITPNQKLVNPIIEEWVKYVQASLASQRENFKCPDKSN